MQKPMQAREELVTVPVSWLADLLNKVPVKCIECGLTVPASETDSRGVCDRCVLTKKSSS